MTGIQWTEETWNPVRGCSRVSEGCRNCYAERQAIRQAGPGGNYEGLVRSTKSGPRWTGKVRLVPEMLDRPLWWKKPRRIFVNSMSDLFHEGLSNEEIAAVFGIMAAAPQHTFQVLTKRSMRMREWFEWIETRTVSCHPLGAARGVRWHAWHLAGWHALPWESEVSPSYSAGAMPNWKWPLPNVWLGVSAEDQRAFDERVPDLLQTPAAVRWVSAEPLLGPIDVSAGIVDALHRSGRAPRLELDWIVVGGESGPGARPCALEWIESIVDQCHVAGAAVFVKQLGAYSTSLQRVAPIEMFSQPEKMAPHRVPGTDECWAWRASFAHPKGGDPGEWPVHLRVREYPEVRP